MRATVYGPSSGLGAVEPELKVDRTGVNNNNNNYHGQYIAIISLIANELEKPNEIVII